MPKDFILYALFGGHFLFVYNLDKLQPIAEELLCNGYYQPCTP